MHPLDGSRAKLGRAREHFEALADELRAAPPENGRFWKANPDPLEAKVEREGLEHALYLRLAEEPEFQRWGLLIGDGMHNRRCALDHAVCDLAIRASRKTRPPWSDNSIPDHRLRKWAGQKWRIRFLLNSCSISAG